MEARLAKMRVTGLKYDSGNIHTHDLKLDFTIPESMPGHAAYILRNGGGKGVFFQSLFQTLDPLTSWKKDLNHVHHFFFNDEEKPIEYTFHIVQEWQVSLSKRVILGIAVTPRLVLSDKKAQSRSPIELDYFLYTMEPLVIETTDIFDFPLWDEKEKEAVHFNIWKEAIKSNKSFNFYSKQDRDSYIEKIEEYGYDSNTVKILKRINDGEGGFGEFFKGSTDNAGLFYNLLIPTINDKIEGIDSRNKTEVSIVSTWFLEALKISKELPDLLAMIDSIEQINDLILPLQDRFKEGEVLKDNVNIWESKGSELFQLLTLLKVHKEKQVVELEYEQNNRKEQLDIAKWKYANIDFIAMCQERDENNRQYNELEQEKIEADLALKRYQSQLLEEKVNLELKKRKNILDELDINNQSISTLMKSENLKEASEGIKEIKKYFKEHWDSISENWQKEMNRNARSIIAHEHKIKQLMKEIDSENQQKRELEFKVHDLSKEMDQFEKKIEEACENYGKELPYRISEFIDEIRLKMTQVKLEIESATNYKSILDKEILDTRIEIANQKNRVREIGVQIQQVKSEIINATQKENVLVANISNLLKIHYPSELERETYYEIRNALMNNYETTRNAHKELLRKMWSLQEDIQLIVEGNKIGSYIANSDLLKVKQLLDLHHINSMYGSEYLQHLQPDEKKYELERNPALRYSIVIMEESFESLNLSFIEQEIIRNHVALIDKTKSNKKDKQNSSNPYLDKQDEINYLFKDLSYIFIEDEYEFRKWKVSVEKFADDVEFEIEALEKKIEQMDKISKELEVLLSGILKSELALKLFNLQIDEKNQNDSLYNFKMQLEEKEEALKKKAEEAELLSNKLIVLEKDEKNLVMLEKGIQQDKINRDTKMHFLKLIEEIEDHILIIEQEKEKIIIQNTNNSLSYNKWFGYVQSNYKTLRQMLKNIKMPVESQIKTYHKNHDLRSHSYGYSLSKEAREHIIRYHELDKNISNKNIRLAELKQNVKTLGEKVIDLENCLQELSGDSWREISVPESDELHLVTLKTQAERQLEKAHTNVNEIEGKIKFNREELKKLEKRLEDKKKDMEKDYPRFGAEFIEIPDCKIAKEQFRKDRNSLERQYNVTMEEIFMLRDSIKVMEQINRLLNDLKLPVHTSQVLLEKEKIIIHENPMEYYTKWNKKYNSLSNDYRYYQESLGKQITQIKEKIESFSKIPETYQKELVYFLSTIRDMSFDNAVASLRNYLNWAKDNLKDEIEQKEKANKAVDLCAERQSRRVLDVVNILQDLVRKLTIVNWKKERFPLIKYSKNFPFPTKLEDIKPLVKELCMNEIDYYVRNYKDEIDNFTVHDIKKNINISKLVLKAMGDFPRLLIHIPGIEGGLLRGEAKYAVYKEWETINQGSVTSSTKSGGQTLLAHFIVIAMLMRQRVEESNPLFLVTDNPFGTMSAPELVEGVFSLMDLLKIQWLVVAPPITNVSITSKFSTINNMTIEMVEGRKVLEKKLIKNHRKYLHDFSVLDIPEAQDNLSS